MAERAASGGRIELRWDERGAAGRIAHLTVAHPGKLNILDRALMRALLEQASALADAQGLRAVVLSGEGERAFIGGADIRDMVGLSRDTAAEFITLLHRACAALRALPVPVIARIDGYALGAGLEVAAACDLRIASERALFGMPEVKVGIPSVIEAALLPPLIGWGRTRRLLMTGETIDAATAESWGLIEWLVPPEELDAAVEQVISAILGCGAHALRLQKSLMQEWEELPLSAAIERGVASFASSFASDEPRRMMSDFLAAAAARRRQRGGA